MKRVAVPQASDQVITLANTAGAVTYSAIPGKVHVIRQVVASYDALPTGGELVINRGAVPVYHFFMPAAGPVSVVFDPPISGQPGEQVSVVIAAGGGVVRGSISVTHDQE